MRDEPQKKKSLSFFHCMRDIDLILFFFLSMDVNKQT